MYVHVCACVCVCPQVELPRDPDLPASEAPCSVSFSTNSGHVAVCWASGPVAIYECMLPSCFYDSSIVDRPPDAPPLDLSGGHFKLVLHFPMKIIKREYIDCIERTMDTWPGCIPLSDRS